MERIAPMTRGADWRVVCEWMPDEKHYLSQKAGYDVGVPATIDHLILAQEQALRTLPERRTQFQWHLVNWEDVPKRDDLVSLFFKTSSESNRDPDGKTKAHGELIRFGERYYSIPFYQVRLNMQLVDDYVSVNQLSRSTNGIICERLGIV